VTDILTEIFVDYLSSTDRTSIFYKLNSENVLRVVATQELFILSDFCDKYDRDVVT
jgi:hypothetical protein